MKILVVLTGGTFGSISTNKGLNVANFKLLEKVVGDLIKKLPYSFDFKLTIPFVTLSEEMTPKDWEKLILHIQDNLKKEKFDAIIVVHGTDTMSYTGSALAYVFNNLNIPIILTGANYPIFEENSDAENNFIKSTYFAVWAIKNNIQGVFIVFSGRSKGVAKIHLAVRSKKQTWEDYCYKSYYIGSDELGVVKKDGNVDFKWDAYDYLLRNKKEYYLRPSFNYKNFYAIKIYPGLSTSVLDSILDKEIKYFLLELYSSGTGPALKEEFGLVPFIRSVINAGGLVFAVSQHEGGRGASMNTYSTSLILKESGVIPLSDMIWEAAIPKIMLALGNFEDKNQIKEFLLTNVAGEVLSEI